MQENKNTGIWYGIGAYTLWGILPMYWKFLKQIPAGEILAHRILWSFVFVTALLIAGRGFKEMREVLANTKKTLSVAACAICITFNWGLYIWAVNNNHIVECSMGYYINPLLAVFFGIVILRERLNFWQLVSLAIAAVGVIFLTVEHGRVPWVALSLAISFGLYGLFKKLAKIEPMTGLALETMLIAPFALAYLLYLEFHGTGAFFQSSLLSITLLMFAGIVTAMPLLWFAEGTKRVPLSTMGFLQYLAPTISLILGVFVFKEAFTRANFISFSFIWAALVLYSLANSRALKQYQPQYFKYENQN